MSPRHNRAPQGVLRALWTVFTPLKIKTRAPSHAGLVYRRARRPGVQPLLDVYLPDGEGPHPSVVLIHGGGFVMGSRTMKPMRYLATRLREAGYAVVVPDYRLLFRGAHLEEARDDVIDAITWWQGAAERYGADPERISIMGLSAGATLMWLGLKALARAPASIVSVFGLYDFTWLSGRRATWLADTLLSSRDLASRQSRSPLSHATARPPCLLVHGDADQLTPVAHAHEMKRLRDAAGRETTLDIVADARHGFFNAANDPVCEPCITRIITFLDAQGARR